MKIQFPAAYYGMIHTDQNQSELKARALEAIDLLGWKRVNEEENQIFAKVGINWKSWGESIHIALKENRISIESKCWWDTQCFDWGKNKDNVMLFLLKLNPSLQIGDEPVGIVNDEAAPRRD